MKLPRIISWFAKRIAYAGGDLDMSNDEHWKLNGVRFGYASTGEPVTHANAERVAAVYTCVKIISEDIAGLPIDIFKYKDDGDKELMAEHPIAKLLQRPNVEHSGYEWVAITKSHEQLRGTGLSVALREDPTSPYPTQLVPVHPDHWTAHQTTVRDSMGRRRWAFAVHSDMADVPSGVYQRDEVILSRTTPIPGTPLGIDPISHAAESIGAALAADKHAGRFFANGLTPSLVLEGPLDFDAEEDRTNLLDSVLKHFGRRNQHKPLVLDQGVTAKVLQMTAEQSQFLESRQFTDRRIASIFRVAPHKINQHERATHSNIAEENRAHLSQTLYAPIKSLEGAIEMQLLTSEDLEAGIRCEVNTRKFMRGDLKAETAFHIAMVQNGIWNSDEVRQDQGKNKIPGGAGEVYERQVNMEPIGTTHDDEEERPAPPREDQDKNLRVLRFTK